MDRIELIKLYAGLLKHHGTIKREQRIVGEGWVYTLEWFNAWDYCSYLIYSPVRIINDSTL